VRQALSVEAGTNDVVVLPILLVLIAVAQARVGGAGDWLLFLHADSLSEPSKGCKQIYLKDY
jgi:hypothetical protein